MAVETATPASRWNRWRTVSRRLRWPVAAWVLLFAMSLLTLVLYVVGTPVYFAWFSTLCTDCLDERLTPAKLQTLQTLGISLTAYATYWTAINLFFVLA